ncbi:MipA/OmpV family protein [Reyranella aquatilis]|uniref:MipA/OmpV family protein n=1 Tax=Reyranella aquatilis TaxID=2035356 RepID=A0ABS8L2C4_9HYPH|nr:MipA/OmpV family protein [Reyranella aquatilis]MCC8432456.1 MipA/OmpV family protein [Reyranella aquatilis]
MTTGTRFLSLAGLSAGVVATVVAGSPAAGQALNDPFAARKSGKDWQVTLGVGGAVRPAYEGGDTYVVTPIPYLNVVWRDTVALDPTGLSAYWRFDRLQVGGGVTYSLGRNQSGGVFEPGNWRLRGLGDIPGAVGARGFVNYNLGPARLGVTATKFLMDGNSGLLVDTSIEVPWRIDDRFMVAGRAFATWADSSYTQTYFGVTSLQSINSGYSTYGASAGIKNFGFELRALYQFAPNWTFSVSSRISQLGSIAADSPISASDTAFMVISTVGYRF